MTRTIISEVGILIIGLIFGTIVILRRRTRSE